jgi:hypothetical protein
MPRQNTEKRLTSKKSYPTNEETNYYDEYSFHTPTGGNDKDLDFIRTAEFEGLLKFHQQEDRHHTPRQKLKAIIQPSTAKSIPNEGK